MIEKILYQWTGWSWMLLGLPTAVAFGALDMLAIHEGLWADRSGWIGGVAVILGYITGAALFFGLMFAYDAHLARTEGRR